MRYFKPRDKNVKLTSRQQARIADGLATTKGIRAEIKLRQEGAYCKAKLKHAGLWDQQAARRGSLVVYRVGDRLPSA